MQTKTKIGVWVLVAALAAAGMIFADSAQAATITDVSPENIWTNQANTVAITGSGFDDTTGMTLFRHTDYTPADEIRTVDVDFDVFSDDRAEIYVPAGLRTGWYDLWVAGNDGGGELENALWIGSVVTPSVSQLNYTVSKKVKRTINLTFDGVVLGKKAAWATVKLNGRKVKVKRVSKNGNSSTVVIEVKYGRWARGSYNVNLKYKNRVREEIDSGDDVRYRWRWDSDDITYENVLEII
jgi:hypothetical protein